MPGCKLGLPPGGSLKLFIQAASGRQRFATS